MGSGVIAGALCRDGSRHSDNACRRAQSRPRAYRGTDRLLVRRFLVFPVLEEQSRIDHKTGLLNVSTWESEAENEISRSIRTRNPAALALVDICLLYTSPS